MSKSDPQPAPTVRLVSFRAATGQLPGGINLNQVIHTANPAGHLDGWSIRIRGASVFLITPRGWTRERSHGSRNGFDPKGPFKAFELPRSEFTFEWECDDMDAVDKLQRYDSPPMTFKRAEPEPVVDATMGDP